MPSYSRLKRSRKLTATEKRLIREYVTPHTVEEAAIKFNAQLTRVRAIMTKGKHVSPEKPVKRSGKSYRKPAKSYLYSGPVNTLLNVAR